MSECDRIVRQYYRVELVYPDDLRSPGLGRGREKITLCLRHVSERSLLERDRLREYKKRRRAGAPWYTYTLIDEGTTEACADAPKSQDRGAK